jgi:hypothetical protein
MTVTGGLIASGGLLTVDGTAGTGITVASAGWSSSSSSVLDLKGTINFSPSGSFPAAPALNPGGGTVQLDSATINTSSSNLYSLYTGAGQITAATGVNTLNGSLLPNSSNSTVASYTIKNGATLNINTTNASNPAISGNNFTMENGSVLSIAGANKSIKLSGNFSFQQTNPSNWTYGTTAGLGPDLIMTGGTSTSPTTLEVGGINQGNVTAGFTNNFALNSLTLSSGAYVNLVDQFANATLSGWTSGSEALYLNNLFGTSTTTYGTLNLDGLTAYLQGYGQLQPGIFTDPNGKLVDIVDTAPVPELSTMTMMLVGFSSLLCLAAVRRRKSSEIACATASC